MAKTLRPAIDKLSRLLDLKEDPLGQDWEIECSDPDRIEEFLDCYETHAKTDDERCALMMLILGAYEEYHYLSGYRWEHWPRIKAILEKDKSIHLERIKYYQCYDEEGGEDIFPITKRMRDIEIG